MCSLVFRKHGPDGVTGSQECCFRHSAVFSHQVPIQFNDSSSFPLKLLDRNVLNCNILFFSNIYISRCQWSLSVWPLSRSPPSCNGPLHWLVAVQHRSSDQRLDPLNTAQFHFTYIANLKDNKVESQFCTGHNKKETKMYMLSNGEKGKVMCDLNTCRVKACLTCKRRLFHSFGAATVEARWNAMQVKFIINETLLSAYRCFPGQWHLWPSAHPVHLRKRAAENDRVGFSVHTHKHIPNIVAPCKDIPTMLHHQQQFAIFCHFVPHKLSHLLLCPFVHVLLVLLPCNLVSKHCWFKWWKAVTRKIGLVCFFNVWVFAWNWIVES